MRLNAFFISLSLAGILISIPLARGMPFFVGDDPKPVKAPSASENGTAECAKDLMPEQLGPHRLKMQVPGSTEGLLLSVPDEVFSGHPIYAYRLLQAAMAEIRQRAGSVAPVRKVLVVGTGSGYEAIALAKTFAEIHVSATDVIQSAVQTTMSNAEEHQLIGRVNAWKADLMDGMRAAYDLILFNAPRAVWKADILAETTGEMDELEWKKITSKPDFFDPDGALLTRFLNQLTDRLRPGGAALVMTNELLGTGLPPGLHDLILSKDPWGSASKENFVIRRIAR